MTITDSISDLKLTPDSERLGLLIQALDNPHSKYGSLDCAARETIRTQVLEYARKHRIKPKNFGPKPQKPTSQKRERVRTCKPKPQEAVPPPVPVAPLLLDTTELAREFSIEAQKIYQPEKLRVPGRFALCWREGTEPFQQELYDVSQLDNVMHRVAGMPERDRRHFWLSQSTYAPYAVDRRISSIMLLNAVWVDIDILHPPNDFPADELPPLDCERDAEVLARILVAQVEDEIGLTASQVVATGGGLLLRFNFEEAIPTLARARWTSVQKHLVKLVSDLRPAGFTDARQWRWPVDASASDAARILRLVGTVNPKWGHRCRVIFDSGKRYSFDELADRILPYTRDEVAEFRARMAQFNQWTKNRQKAAAAGIRTGKRTPVADKQALIEDEAVRAVWTARFEFGRELLTARGGARDGHRNNLFWPMATALAWSAPGVPELTQELAALHQQHFSYDGWTRAEALQSAGSVIKRMHEGKDKLYKMRSETFAQLLETTDQEMREFGHLLSASSDTHNLRRSAWDKGVMGFEKMKGLSAEAFIAETRRRQAEAGRYAAETRKTNHPPELRELARAMAAQPGRTVREIADALGVSVATAHRWCKLD